MVGLLCFALAVLTLPFRSKLRLEAENAVLRHQLIVLRRRLHGRVRFTNNDRWFFIQLYRWFPSILQVLTILRPETLVRWHRAGFRCYWRWKSRPLGGRPQIETELRVPVPGLGAVWPAIVVGITVFFLVIVASIDLLSVVPANVYGYERSNRSVIVIAALRRRVTGEHKPP